jgi:hypothetical protein
VATSPRAHPEADDRRWSIVGRRQEYDGQGRTNLPRIAGIAPFTIVELVNTYGLNLGSFEMPRLRGRLAAEAGRPPG